MDSLPEKIGGCRITAKLGQGGMGAVYRARHETLSREVAIKVLPPAFTQNNEYVQRFLREARAAAQLQHSNVVQVYDAGEQAGQYYITMEFVDGTSLAHRLVNEGMLSEQESLGYLIQAARGLAAAHARGLIHRDIKPENLLINKENTLKIADFGLVTASTSDGAGLTQEGAMLGTPLYMSPEQGEGQVADSRSDLYSLGVTFFRALTGSTPFNAPSPIGIIYKHKYEPTPDPKTLKPGLAPATAQLLLRLMAKKPEERFQSADQVARTAEALLSQMQTGQVPAELPAVAPGPPPVSPSGAMPAVSDSSAFAPTVTPVRGEPGVATIMPRSAAAIATPPPVAAQQQPPTLPPGQAGTPLPQMPPPGQVYTPVPQPGTGSSPVYAPTPGMPAHGALTPSPVPPPKSRAALVLVCVAALLVLLAGGGFFGYKYYRKEQVVAAKQQAELMRTNRQYDQAIALLEETSRKYPEAPELITLRDGIEAQSVNERITLIKEQARQYHEDRKYDAEAKAYQEAEALLAKHNGLSGVLTDETLADRRLRAENLHQFTLFMSEGRAAEKEKRFDVAEKAYLEAAKFEVKGEDQATQAATRARFMDYVAQADNMESSRNYPEALKLLERAAALNVGDVDDQQNRIRNAMDYERLTSEALKAQESGQLRQAAELLDRAVRHAATNEEADRLRDQSKKLSTEADFRELLLSGEKAMTERRWKDAQTAWEAALKVKPEHTQATALLKRCKSNELADEALDLQQKNDLAGALVKLQAARKEDPENEAVVAAIGEVEERIASVRDLVASARQAESAGDWKGAEEMWKSLMTQDPANRSTYEQRATNARFEEFMAKCKQSLSAGNLEEALRHAKAAQPFDSTGGQRAQAQIQEIQGRIQAIALAKQKAATTQAALNQANNMAAQGQFEEAAAVMTAALQNDPGNAQLGQMKNGLEAIAAVQRTYKRMEGYRQDAEAAIQNAYAADDDKKILAQLAEVQAWRDRLAQGPPAAQAAWQAQRFEDLAAQSEAAKGLAREMGQLFANHAAVFHGRAASAAKPKANVGGTIGGFGIGRRTGGFGGFGANADVGDNQKKAGIFDGTARSLERCAESCRALAE